MAPRYGRRIADGTYEYHDSKAPLDEARERDSRSERAGLFGLIGVLIGGLLSYFFVHKWGTDWPKWLRFGLVIGGAGISAYVLAMLADWIWDAVRIVLLLGLLYGLGHFLWQAL